MLGNQQNHTFTPSGARKTAGLMGLVGVSWTRRGESVDLRIGSIALEPLFLFSYSHVSTIRAREAAVQDSDTSVYKMHEKDSEDSVHKMHEGWEMEDRRWKRGGEFGRLAAGSPMASHPNPFSIGRRKEKRDCASASPFWRAPRRRPVFRKLVR